MDKGERDNTSSTERFMIGWSVYLCLMSFSRWRLPLLVCDWKTCSLSFYSFIVTCHSRFNIKGYLGTLLVIISRNVRGRATTSATTDLRRIWRCSYRDRNVKVSIVRGVVGLKVLSSPYSKSFLWLIYVLSWVLYAWVPEQTVVDTVATHTKV